MLLEKYRENYCIFCMEDEEFTFDSRFKTSGSTLSSSCLSLCLGRDRGKTQFISNERPFCQSVLAYHHMVNLDKTRTRAKLQSKTLRSIEILLGKFILIYMGNNVWKKKPK